MGTCVVHVPASLGATSFADVAVVADQGIPRSADGQGSPGAVAAAFDRDIPPLGDIQAVAAAAADRDIRTWVAAAGHGIHS